jgi:predicted Fe-Mo cluster-binding NifX family protein
MNICIPVDSDQGLQSRVCGHFGSAPAFVIVDLDTSGCRAVINTNQEHQHGGCAPLHLLQGEHIDGMVVGGIGRGALAKLRMANTRVYLAEQATVGEVVTAYKAGSLKLMQPDMACGGHGHGDGHAHA